jgi:hypothetical protein
MLRSLLRSEISKRYQIKINQNQSKKSVTEIKIKFEKKIKIKVKIIGKIRSIWSMRSPD